MNINCLVALESHALILLVSNDRYPSIFIKLNDIKFYFIILILNSRLDYFL